jgi:ketosteroid isomerase-like protein
MSRSPLQTLHDYVDATNRGDVDTMMSFYAEDAVLINPLHVHVGKAAIRDSAAKMLADLPHLKADIVTEQAHGDTVLVVWKGNSDTVTVPVGVQTLIIRDGRIALQTYWWELAPK